MATSYTNILSAEDINYLNHLPEVLDAKSKLDTSASGKIYFSVNLTESIRNALTSRFGVELSNVTTIPMRWIKGDTAPHVDVGASNFERTYLVYLNNSAGELVVDGTDYPILENTGYVFNEGLSHETLHTGDEPRLMIGPMSEQAFAVGGGVVYYFPTLNDALAFNYGTVLGLNSVSAPTPFVVGDITSGNLLGITMWRIASNSSGSSSQSVAYANGSTLVNDGSYILYPNPHVF